MSPFGQLGGGAQPLAEGRLTQLGARLDRRLLGVRVELGVEVRLRLAL